MRVAGRGAGQEPAAAKLRPLFVGGAERVGDPAEQFAHARRSRTVGGGDAAGGIATLTVPLPADELPGDRECREKDD